MILFASNFSRFYLAILSKGKVENVREKIGRKEREKEINEEK